MYTVLVVWKARNKAARRQLFDKTAERLKNAFALRPVVHGMLGFHIYIDVLTKSLALAIIFEILVILRMESKLPSKYGKRQAFSQGFVSS